MKADEVKRLKELERENASLKRIVADKELENLALREVARGNFYVTAWRSLLLLYLRTSFAVEPKSCFGCSLARRSLSSRMRRFAVEFSERPPRCRAC